MKSKLLLLACASVSLIGAFDWQQYLERYPDLQEAGIINWWCSFVHYLNNGIKENRTSVDERLTTSSFDWQYYIEHNQLEGINTEAEARDHYTKVGYFQGLEYCKKYSILMCLHLYSMQLTDDYVQKINRFMTLNDQNSYHLMINVPVGDNVKERSKLLEDYDITRSAKSVDEGKLAFVRSHAPYHPEVITEENYLALYDLMTKLNMVINLPKERINIMFSANRGMDIGGFLLQVDQLKQHPIPHDFLIKLHTKTNPIWGDLNASFMTGAVNPVLRAYDGIYTNRIHADFKEDTDTFSKTNQEHLAHILSDYGLRQKAFDFSGGSVFIVSSKFTDFLVAQENLLARYNDLSLGKAQLDELLEHAYERFFGYLMTHLDLRMKVIDYHHLMQRHDNRPQDDWPPFEYDAAAIKQAIKDHDIQVMALYFPQFHEVEENNQFWGKGFTEWTLLNKFAGEKKMPHDTIGQYNMLDFETRKKQAVIAKEHGISAFCFYHYWFKDKPVMYKGLQAMLEDGEPNLPFAFCWANERWTRLWDGLDSQVLIEQEYGTQADWDKHFDYLLRFFKHPNYIKDGNKPVLYVYNLKHIATERALKMLTYFKKLARQAGFAGLKIIAFANNFNDPEEGKYSRYISGYAEHQPTYNGRIGGCKPVYALNATNYLDVQWIYETIINNKKVGKDYTRGIFYGWDNSSRRVNLAANKFVYLSYKSFERLIVKTIENIVMGPNSGTNYIMLNSWNEWCEQAMVEPTDQDGYAVLRVLKKIFG